MPTLAASTTDILLANAALAEIGVEAIESLEQTDIRGRTVNRLIIDAKEAALSMHPWRFARKMVTLASSPESVPPPFGASYAITSDILLIHRVWEGEQSVVFDRFGDVLAIVVCNQVPSSVDAECTVDTDPVKWPAYFRQSFVKYFASILCKPITQDERLAALLAQEASTMFRFARTRDSQGRTPPRIDTKTFIRARRRHGSA